MAESLDVVRDLGAIVKAFEDVKKEMTDTKSSLASVNRALKLDSNNVELLEKRSKLTAIQLEENKQKSQLLGEAITELNRIKKESGELDQTQTKQLATFTKQQEEAENQILGLTGKLEKQKQAQLDVAESAKESTDAIKIQTETTKAAEETTKSFSQSMTEFQSKLSAVRQVMSGVINTYELLGGDKDSAMGKTLQQSQKVLQAGTQLASMGKLLQGQNILTAGSFGNLALSAGAAFGSFALVNSLIGKLNPEAQKTVGIITAVAGALTAGAVAALAFKGVLTWGAGIPIMLAAVGAGIAGLKAAIGDAAFTNEAIGGGGSLPSTAIPSVSTPTVPSYSSGGGSVQSQTIVQTLSQRQLEDATYAAFTRVVIEQGLNDPTIIDKTDVTLQGLRRVLFKGITNPDGTINVREVL